MISTTADTPIVATERRSFDVGPGITAVAIVAAAAYLNAVVNWRQSALFLVGAFAGVVLYHAAFGFTSSWRVFISDRRGAGLRAQMLMLAVTCAVFFPLLAPEASSGSLYGDRFRRRAWPCWLARSSSAIGMQLGGGCASGTLYSPAVEARG